MLFLFKVIIWFVISSIVEAISSLAIAGLLLFLLNFTGVPFLASLGYWQLFWLQLAAYQVISGPVVIGITHKEFMRED